MDCGIAVEERDASNLEIIGAAVGGDSCIAVPNVYFVKYDVTVSFMALVLDTVTYFVSHVLVVDTVTYFDIFR